MTDAKLPAVARHPIALFYQELWRELAEARAFVVAGYAFGDEPVNRVIKHWLGARSDHARRLEVWSQSAERARARFEERIGDVERTGGGGPAVTFRPVSLPSASAVEALEEVL